MTIQIKRLQQGDENVLNNVSADVFDHSVDVELSRSFLTNPSHHIAVALDDGLVVGMATAVHYVHPDKSTELWLNEVGVAQTHHRQGIATKMLESLFEAGRRQGCKQAWVLTDRGNSRAMNFYASFNHVDGPDDCVMYTFNL